jgi:hypothetical protein
MESKNTKQLKEAFDNWRVYTSLNEQESEPSAELYSQFTKEQRKILGFLKLVSISNKLELLYLVNLSDIDVMNESVIKETPTSTGAVTLLKTDLGIFQITHDKDGGISDVQTYSGKIDDDTVLLTSEQYKQAIEDSDLPDEIAGELILKIDAVGSQENAFTDGLSGIWTYISDEYLQSGYESMTWENVVEVMGWSLGGAAIGAGVYGISRVMQNYFGAPRVQARLHKRAKSLAGRVLKRIGATGNPMSKNVGLEDFKERMRKDTFRTRRGLARTPGVPDISDPLLGYSDQGSFDQATKGRSRTFTLKTDADGRLVAVDKPNRHWFGSPGGVNPDIPGLPGPAGTGQALAGQEFRMTGEELEKHKKKLETMVHNAGMRVEKLNQIANSYQGAAGNPLAQNRIPWPPGDLQFGPTRGTIEPNINRDRQLLKNKKEFLEALLQDIEKLQKYGPGKAVDFRDVIDFFGKIAEKPLMYAKAAGKGLSKAIGSLGLWGKAGMGAITFAGILVAKDTIDGYLGYLGDSIVGAVAAAISEIPFLEDYYIGYLEEKAVEAQEKLIKARGDYEKANLEDLEYVILKSIEKKLETDKDLKDKLLARQSRSKQNPEEYEGGYGPTNFPDKTPPGYEKIIDPTGKVSYKKKEKLEENKSRLKITLGVLKESKQKPKLKITLG